MNSTSSIPVTDTEMTMMVQSLMAIIEATSMALECDSGNEEAREERQVARNLLMKIIIRVINHNNEPKHTLIIPVETNPELN